MVTETIPVTRTPGRVYARRTFLVPPLHICVCACIVGNLFLLHRFLHLHCRFCIIIIIFFFLVYVIVYICTHAPDGDNFCRSKEITGVGSPDVKCCARSGLHALDLFFFWRLLLDGASGWMYGISEDGGAFAECYFAQYPLGMGKTPPPPFVREAVLALRKHTDRSPPSSTDKSLALVPATAALSSHEATEGNVSGNSDKLAQTTERTREALELVLQERRKEEEERDFSGRNLKRGQRKKPALELTLSADVAAVGMHDPAPIVRSPTKVPKEPADFSGDRNGNTSSASTTVVPFSISNWKNKRKLIISLEQRIAQHAEARPVGGESISDNVMQLAVAMQQARKEVEAEQLAREKARMEEEERRQAEREAEATQRAKEILEKTASDALHSSGDRKKETREERLERIRLERELREREKQQELRQRRLAKAATRLGMSVEALEADEELLKNIDNPTTTRIGAGSDYICPPSGGGVSTGNKAAGAGQSEYGERPPTLHADELEEDTRPPGTCGIRKGVFGSAVISNEGIRREMEALAKLEEGGSEPKDGLRLVGDDDLSSGDDEDDGLGMDKLMKKKKKRRL